MFTTPEYTYASNNPTNRVDPSGFVDWPSCIIGTSVATCRLEFNDTLWGIAREVIHLNGNSNIYNNERINRVMVPQMQELNPNLYSQSFGWDCPTCLADTINLPGSWLKGFMTIQTPPPRPVSQQTPTFSSGNPPPPLPPFSNGCPLPKTLNRPIVHKIGPVDIILFPGGPPDLDFEYKNKTVARSFTSIGVLLDVVETGGALYPYSGIPEISAFIDVGIAGLGSFFDGETYIAQPHPDLPRMAVVGQDVLVASAETAVGTIGKWALTAGSAASGNPFVAVGGALGGIALDTTTSASQAVYDASRLYGVFPTVVSVGGYLDERWYPRIAFMFYNPF